MQVTHVGKRLLGESNAPAMAAQIGGKLLADRLHRAHCRGPQTEGLQTKVGARPPGLALRVPSDAPVWSALLKDEPTRLMR
jgi:hypothetical protein